jgi:hypothetical protein
MASDLTLIDEHGVRAVEGPPGRPLMTRPEDASRVIEACLSAGVFAALLYAPNLTPAFFDLSSREAGEILQKLRNYDVRLAVACPQGNVTFSRRFGEVIAEERPGRFFGVFDTRGEALEWLSGSRGERPVEALRDEVIALAASVLEGTTSAVLAARRMLLLLRLLGVPDDDPVRLCLVVVESETDALPVGMLRVEWAAEALKRKEPDIARAEAWAREVCEDALRNVANRWGKG